MIGARGFEIVAGSDWRRTGGADMGELTTDPTTGEETTARAATAAATVAHGPGHHAIGCPECFEELQSTRDWL